VKIRSIEVFQVSWAPDDKPQQRSAFVRIHGDGLFHLPTTPGLGLVFDEAELAEHRVRIG
jgi:L-alanine-DL-glutamate epimerase-like enolase superfamily enzyme